MQSRFLRGLGLSGLAGVVMGGLGIAGPGAGSGSAGKAGAGAAPRELGKVRWTRDHDRALASGKPVFLQFQEVPGCSNCTRFGDVVLSHPLLVEAIEDLFVPVLVYNNRGGPDAALLRRYGEPSWNNPVVRIVGSDGRLLAPRVANTYTVSGVARAMVAALREARREVPGYLELLTREARARATFAMSCFWVGEAKLGRLPGVARTRTGWLGGKEVVEVEYDPSMVEYEALLTRAREMSCATRVFARTGRQMEVARARVGGDAVRSDEGASATPKDDKYQLRRSVLRFLPMVEAQATRVNAAVGFGEDFEGLLSPRQVEVLEVIRAKPGAGWESVLGAVDFDEAWERVVRKVGEVGS